MDLRRFRVRGTDGRRLAGGRWLACAGMSMALGSLAVARAEPQVPAAGGRSVEGRGTVVATQPAPAAFERSGAVDIRGGEAGGVEHAPGRAAAANGVQDAGDRSGAGTQKKRADVQKKDADPQKKDDDPQEDADPQKKDPDAGKQAEDDGETRTEAEPEAGGREGAEVRTRPEGGGADAPSASDSEVDAPVAADTLQPVAVVSGDILPAAQSVTGTDVKLDGVLLELLRARRAGGEAGLRAYVAQHRPALAVDRLRVEIVCASVEAAAVVREQVAAADGIVTTSFDTYVWAEVSLDGVEALAGTEAVWTIAVTQALVRPGGR